MIFALVEQLIAATPRRFVYQTYLFFFAGAYFVWHWVGGQTLAMRTWHMKLIALNGSALTVRQAMMRYVLASCGLALFGYGFVWALFDREHQFLHDRLSGTRIVRC